MIAKSNVLSRDAGGLDEARVVEGCLRGDRGQFRLLFDRHRQGAYRLAYGILRNQEDALDASQEAFLKAFRGLKRFDRKRGFAPWFFKIVRNAALDLLRRRRLRAERGEELAREEGPTSSVSPSPEQGIAGQELGERLQRALGTLSAEHREIFLLREVEQLSYEQIAEVVGVAKGTVMSRLYYARQKLRQELEGWL